MKFSRRLTFQLTPLLDLFLIVIFAQYLEMQDSTVKAEARIKQEANQTIQSLQEELQKEQDQLNAARKDLAAATLRSAQIESQLEERENEWKNRLKEVLEQQDDTGDLISELFQVPDDILNEAINQTVQESPKRSDEEIERLKETFQELARKRGRETIVHLLTFEEMRKRMDLWEVFIEEDGQVQLNAGKEKFDFRASTEKEFSDKLFSCYKSMQEPKSLVIILLSYGNARSGIRRAAINGLPLASERMQKDSLGRSRFDYAVLGYYPKPQLDQNNE